MTGIRVSRRLAITGRLSAGLFALLSDASAGQEPTTLQTRPSTPPPSQHVQAVNASPTSAAAAAEEARLKRDLEAAVAQHGPVSAETATEWRGLADFYFREQRLREAAAALEQALSIVRTIEGDGLNTARVMQNLGSVYHSDHQPQKAQPLLRVALAIRERILGPDHPDLAVVLLNIGGSLRATGDFAQALPLMQRALAIRERGLPQGHPDVAWATEFLGALYREVGQFQDALPMFERSLLIREQAFGPDNRLVSRSLSHLAALHRDMGNPALAAQLYERALQVDQKTLGPDHPDLTRALASYTVALRDLGEYARALPLAERSLQIELKAFGPDHPRVAAALTDLALLHRALGDDNRAIAQYQRALQIEEQQPSPSRGAISLRLQNLGVALVRSGEPARARPLFERALTIDTELYGDQHPRLATTLASLALLDRDGGRIEPARKTIMQALQIEQKALGAQHPSVAVTLLSRAQIEHSAGDPQAATDSLVRALLIASRGDQPDTLWRVQHALAVSAARTDDRALAIYWGKQAVNTVQSLRGRLAGLSADLQRAFLADKRGAYTHLADQLVDAGRLAEAQEVLAMLKEEELYDFTARSGGEDPRGTRASFVGPAETAAERRWREISGQLAQLGRESAELARKARLGLSAEEQARRRQVDADLVVANQQFDRFVAELRRDFAAAGARRAEEFGGRQLQNLVVLQDLLGDLGRDTVLLHYVVADNRVAIILTTTDVQIAREHRIAAAELNRKVLAFRQALAQRRDVRPLARELHEILIAPVAADLQQARARTLMLSLDGTLRYLPFAALNDGRRWLVEDYRLSIYTEAARTQLTRRPQREWSMTGLGLTRAVPGFAALPAVREELEGVRRSLARGEVYLDEQFTAERVRDALAAAPPVMHIASHFQFRPGTFANSFLLLGDGDRLTLQDIRDRRLRFSSVDLLTLSACDTAMGGGVDETGAEVEGFGALAQQQGAHAVLATLWPVADGSTSRFMQLVYARRVGDRQATKADALRDAQLAFVRGRAPDGRLDGRWSHPFFWAPYVLMGNWL